MIAADVISHNDHNAHVSHIKLKHAEQVEKLRLAHKNVVNRHETQMQQKQKAFENAVAEVQRLKSLVDEFGNIDDQVRALNLKVSNLKEQVLKLTEFKTFVLQYWPDAEEDPNSFGRSARAYCQDLIDADAMAPILQSDLNDELMMREAKLSRSSYFKNMIKKVIVARRSEQHEVQGNETLGDVAEEIIVNKDNLENAAHIHTFVKLEREHKLLMENLASRRRVLEQEVVVLRDKHTKASSVNAIKRVMNTHNARQAADKIRVLEKRIREKEDQINTTKKSVKAAKFTNDVVTQLKRKYKEELAQVKSEYESNVIQKDKILRQQQARIKEMETFASQTKVKQLKLETALREYHDTLLNLKKSGKNINLKNLHVLKSFDGTSEKSFGDSIKRKKANSKSPEVNSKAGNATDGQFVNKTSHRSGQRSDKQGQTHKMVSGNSEPRKGNYRNRPQSRDSLTPERRKITRWVLPSKSPEEEDQISLTFGGIPWNTLNACCKNSLLDYGRGNQRSLGHQMIKASPSRSNDKSKRYVVSEEEMAQNLFKNGVY
eukprot:g2905.t1